MKIHLGFDPIVLLKMLREEERNYRRFAKQHAVAGQYQEAANVDGDADCVRWFADELEHRMKTGKGR